MPTIIAEFSAGISFFPLFSFILYLLLMQKKLNELGETKRKDFSSIFGLKFDAERERKENAAASKKGLLYVMMFLQSKLNPSDFKVHLRRK